MAEKTEKLPLTNGEKIEALDVLLAKRVAAIEWTKAEWKSFCARVHAINPTRTARRGAPKTPRPDLVMGQDVECEVGRYSPKTIRHGKFIRWTSGLWCRVLIDGKDRVGFNPVAIAGDES